MKLTDLSKVVKGNTLIDVLQCVRVKNGIAQVTDLEITAQMPCNCANGLYQIKPWGKGLYLTANFSVEDYPDLPGVNGEIIAEVQTIDFKTVKPVLSPDVKFNLGGAGLYYDQNDYLLVATDGHCLITSGTGPSTKDYGDNMVVVSQSIFHLLLLRDKWTVRRGKDNLFFENGDVILTQRIIDQQFPNYRSVLTNDDHKKIGNELLPEFIAFFCEQLKKVNSKIRSNCVMLEVKGGKIALSRQDNDLLKCFYSIADMESEVEVMAAFNASYLSISNQLPGRKQFFAKDGESTFFCTHDRGTFAVMPLNL